MHHSGPTKKSLLVLRRGLRLRDFPRCSLPVNKHQSRAPLPGLVVASGLARYMGRQRKAARASARNIQRLSLTWTPTHARGSRRRVAHCAQPCCLSSLSAIVRVPEWVPHAERLLCLSRVSVWIRRCRQSAVQPLLAAKAQPEEKRLTIVTHVPTQLREQATQIPSSHQESHSRCARVRSVFPECRCYAGSCRCTRRLPNSDA